MVIAVIAALVSPGEAVGALDLLRGLDGAPPVQAARQALDAAALQAQAGPVVTLEEASSLSPAGVSTALRLDVRGSWGDVTPSSGVRRAEGQWRTARLAEARRRVTHWQAARETAMTQAEAATVLQIARLTLQSVTARVSAGTARPDQQSDAALAVQQAELDLKLANLAPNLIEEAAWAALPLPPAAARGLRADVLEASLTVLNAELNLREVQRQAQPSVAVQGSIQSGGVQLSASVTTDRSYATSLGFATPAAPAGWSLGLRATVPLGSGPVQAVRGAQLTLRSSQAILAAVQRDAEDEIGRLQTAIPMAQAAVTLAEQTVRLRGEAAALARNRQTAGLIGELDMLEAERVARTASRALVGAQGRLDALTLDLWEAQGWLPGEL